MMRQTQAATFWASSYAEQSTFYDITNLTTPSSMNPDGSMNHPALKVSIQNLTREAWKSYYWPRITAEVVGDGVPLEDEDLCDILFEVLRPRDKGDTGWGITSIGLYYTGQLCMNLCNRHNYDRRDGLEQREQEEHARAGRRLDLTSQLPPDTYWLLLEVDRTSSPLTIFEIDPQENDACEYAICAGNHSLFVTEKSKQRNRMIEFGEIHEGDNGDITAGFDTYVKAIISEGYCHS